jgi:D-psicose/D-tagatose/L-ribulose 3-epimerase
MPKFGALAYTWVGTWNKENGQKAIENAAQAGLDLIEIPLVNAAGFDADLTSRQLASAGINGVATLALPKEAHLPTNPKRATEFLKLAIGKVEQMGGTHLSGVLYGHAGTLVGRPPTQEERDTCARVLVEIASYADERAITLAIEPVNRYETYLFNVVEDALALIEKVGAPNLKLHVDTYHMNIDEHGFYQPTKMAGDRLVYVHASDSDRGTVGEGNVRWDDFFRALEEINYRGPLVLESFCSVVPEMIAVSCMWRPSKAGIDEMVSRSLQFLRQKASIYKLN